MDELPATPAPAPDKTGRDLNPLFRRVDELARQREEESQRAVEEVPLLTEVIEKEAPPPGDQETLDQALAGDIERVLLVRLVPELNKQVATMRGELEKEIRRTVREAVAHALTARKSDNTEP